MTAVPSETRKVEPLATSWRSQSWNTGSFDTASRRLTAEVEGAIRLRSHLVLVTLSGGAKRLSVTSECGHRYEGRDRPGAVSFVPANCGRRLLMSSVEAAWASLALNSDTDDPAADVRGLAPFTNADDGVLSGLVAEMARLEQQDGALDPLYCESASLLVLVYLARRYGGVAEQNARPWKLAPWRVAQVDAYIDAHLDGHIRIADLAALTELSSGHFHRAFRATTGRTPLAHITGRRIRRAQDILAVEDVSVLEVAFRTGFQSQSHFARTFRRATGVAPSRYRK